MNRTPESQKVVTRFAPSPTGYLHIGGARTALFNWAFARKHGGTFILRIEDTDKARSTPEATRRIIQDLQWLGIDWDEGPNPDATDVYEIKSQRGNHGPYFQSQRDDLYRKYLQQLIDAGRAYEDKGAWRFKMFAEGKRQPITVPDLILGDVVKQPEDLEDFIIFKGEAAGGGPTFHFANVVDDATMQVTHVLRAQEHLNNTHKHVALFEALGLQPPKYAHMPLIFNPDGTKMSKRDKAKVARNAALLDLKNDVSKQTYFDLIIEPANGLLRGGSNKGEPRTHADIDAFLNKKSDDPAIATAIAEVFSVVLPEIDINDFRVSGYLPDVILNYIALLGWSPENKDTVGERFDLNWIRDNFKIEGIGKSNAKFDRTKLLAFNGETLQKLPADQYCKLLSEHVHQYPHGSGYEIDKNIKGERFKSLAAMFQPRLRKLSDLAESAAFFVLPEEAINYEAKAWNKNVGSAGSPGHTTLAQVADVLRGIGEADWSPTAIHNALEQFATSNGKKIGDVAQPLRVAVTGTAVSPAIQDTLTLLGKDSTLKRIERCLAFTPTSA